MSFQAIFLTELAIVYLLGAATGPMLLRLARRLRRRIRGGRKDDWDGYFKH